MGGSESYARALCRALAAEVDVDAVAFVSTSARDAGEGLETRVVPEYPGATSAVAKVAGLAVGVVRRRSMARHFAGIDVVHYPFTVPTPPLPFPSVVTLHDLQHLDLPHLFSRQTRLFRRAAYDRSARRAGIVIVPSSFVRARAEALLGLDPLRVRVVPHGVDHSVFSPSEAAREPFVLYPARVWPHKNHARLLAAFALLRNSRPKLTLVLTGAGTEALAGPPGVSARGVVPERKLVDLYRRASCVVFRVSTRGSERRHSRLWRVGPASQQRAPVPFPRCAATRPSSSIRTTRKRLQTASRGRWIALASCLKWSRSTRHSSRGRLRPRDTSRRTTKLQSSSSCSAHEKVRGLTNGGFRA